MSRIVFETERLIIQRAENLPRHIELYYNPWNNSEVMRNVGFPDGLRISREEISDLIGKKNKRILNALLIVFRKEDNRPIGECKLGQPDDNGIAETDIKLLPEFWGNGYGTEIKRGLVSFLFENTDCETVKATPNKII